MCKMDTQKLVYTTTVCVQQEGRSPTTTRRRGGGGGGQGQGQGRGQGPSSLNRKRTLSRILTTTCSWITQSKSCCFCCCWIEFYCKKLGARHKPLFFFFFSSSLGFSFCVPLSLEKKNCFCFFAFLLFLSCMIDRHGPVWEIMKKNLAMISGFKQIFGLL